MKRLKSIGFLILAATTIFACKKESTSSNVPVNSPENFKSSVWAGEFQYTSGASQILQPFSIVVDNNNTLTWYENGLSLPGVWSIVGSKVEITYTNGQVLSAEVSKDTWTNFSNTGANPRQIANIVRSAIPTAANLDNTKWKGKFIAGSDISITFLPGSKLKYDAGFPMEIPYTIFGAGIKMGQFALAAISSSAYIVPINKGIKGSTTISDFGGTYYSTWSATKQ